MRALTILEPWASMIALGIKTIETRSWPTDVRGRIAIHAGKKFDGATLEELLRCGDAFPILNDHCAIDESSAARSFLDTRGKVIATATLADCVRFRPGMTIPRNDVLYGDTTPGRYGFVLTDVIRLPVPVPAAGALGFWEWDPPTMDEEAA